MGEKRVTQQVASDEIYNDDWFLKDSVLHDTTKVQPSVLKAYFNQGMATSQDLTDAISTEATARSSADDTLATGIGKQMSNLADFYDTTKSYVVGDVCVLQSGELMRCIAPTSGAFDNTKWEQVTVDELFDDLNFSADAISYDNTSSGLEAENVQDAIDETITKLSAVGTASGDIATFPDGSDLSMPKLEVNIEPVQDLHGYDAPWVGGAGKNKLYIPDIAETTRNGVKLSCKNGVITINGTPSEAFSWDLARVTLPSDSYTLSLNQAVSTSSFAIEIDGGSTFTPTGNPPSINFNGAVTNKTVWIYFRTTSTFNNLVIKPMIRLATVSDATFAPYANICPISGFDECNINNSGKNLFGGAYNEYFPIHFNEDKVVVASADVPSESVNPIQIAFYDKNKTLLDYWGLSAQYSAINNRVARSFTLPKESYYLRYITQSSANYQIEFGETNSAYEPYNGHTYTIDLDGTRYGGKVDLVSGVLTVDRAMVDLGSCAWDVRSESVIRCAVSAEAKFESQYKAVNGICSAYIIVAQNSLGDGKISFNNSTQVYLQDNNHTFSTQSDAQQYLNGQKLVYELATPLTIQLTPTQVKSLQGQNNISADCGEVLDAEYIRDLTTIINYILEQLNA